MKARCSACQEPCSDMARRFDRALRFICPDCYEFLLGADKVLKERGIEGVTLHPVRFNPPNRDAMSRVPSIRNQVARLKEADRRIKNLTAQNTRLKAYIAALEPMAVRSLRLTPSQLKSAVRRRQNLTPMTPSSP